MTATTDPIGFHQDRWDRHTTLNRLYDNINELTEPRFIREPHEYETLDPNTGRLLKRTPATHTHILTSLIGALQAAIEPGIDLTNTDQTHAASYESRPAARLDPITVLRTISDEVKTWTIRVAQPRTNLTSRLRALKAASGRLSDTDLRQLDQDAQEWCRTARISTGEDPKAITTNLACPYCGQKQILISGKLDWARCRNRECGVFWPEEWIGILGQALAASASMETLAAPPRCDSVRDGERCTARAKHKVHQDARGRFWDNEEQT